MPTIDITAPYTLAPGAATAPNTVFILDTMNGPSHDFDLLTLGGEVTSTQTAISALYGNPWSHVHILPDATINVTSDPTDTSAAPSATAYVGAYFEGASFINEGAISVVSAGQAYGVNSWMLDRDYNNFGTLSLHASSYAVGFWLHNGGNFYNSGVIDVFSTTSAFGVRMATWDCWFTNEGTIRAHDSTPGYTSASQFDAVNSVAVWFNSSPNLTSNHFVNSGLIEGDIALRVTDYAPSMVATEILNTSTGVIRGLVDMTSQSTAPLVNHGLIDGAINFGSADDAYYGELGRVTGLVSGGGGRDYLAGGQAFDYLQGNQGDDVELGGGGADWVVGGQGDDRLWGDHGDDSAYGNGRLVDGQARYGDTAEDGNDLILGNLGNDTCVGEGGDDTIRGGQGDDSISGETGNDWLSGDRGNDTIAGGAGADIFHTFSGAGLDRVIDFNASEGDRVQVDPGTAYNVIQVGSDTVIDMANGDRMVLVGVQLSSLPSGWLFVA